MVAFLTFSCFFCFFVSTLLVRKYAFSSTTCTLYGSQFLDKSQVGEVNTILEETYIYSTLWNLNCERWYLSPRLGLRLSSRKSLILLLLLIAGDIETCPGPTSDVFPDIKQFIRKRGLRIFHQNARGLHDLGKIEQLKLLMEETNKAVILFTYKCMNGLGPEIFSGYFQRFNHGKRTRGDGINLELPKVNLKLLGKALNIRDHFFLINCLPN